MPDTIQPYKTVGSHRSSVLHHVKDTETTLLSRQVTNGAGTVLTPDAGTFTVWEAYGTIELEWTYQGNISEGIEYEEEGGALVNGVDEGYSVILFLNPDLELDAGRYWWQIRLGFVGYPDGETTQWTVLRGVLVVQEPGGTFLESE